MAAMKRIGELNQQLATWQESYAAAYGAFQAADAELREAQRRGHIPSIEILSQRANEAGDPRDRTSWSGPSSGGGTPFPACRGAKALLRHTR